MNFITFLLNNEHSCITVSMNRSGQKIETVKRSIFLILLIFCGVGKKAATPYQTRKQLMLNTSNKVGYVNIALIS